VSISLSKTRSHYNRSGGGGVPTGSLPNKTVWSKEALRADHGSFPSRILHRNRHETVGSISFPAVCRRRAAPLSRTTSNGSR